MALFKFGGLMIICQTTKLNHRQINHGYSMAETNIQFAQIFARLHNYSTMKVFGYTTNYFGIVILAYLVNIYKFKAILVIQ